MHNLEISAQFSQAARRLLNDELDRLMEESTAQLLELEPKYKPIGEKTLSDQMRKNLSITLLRIAGDEIPEELASAAYETGQIRAIQQVEISAVSRAFRIDLRVLWEAFLRDAERYGTANNSSFTAEMIRIWDAIETSINEMTEGYNNASERLKQQDSELKLAAFRRLMAVGGRGSSPAVAKQLSALAFDPNMPMACIVSDLRMENYAALPVVQARLTSRGVSNYFGWDIESIVGLVQVPNHRTLDLMPLLGELKEARTVVADVPANLGLIDAIYNARVLMDASPKPGLRLLSDHWLEAIAHAEPTLIDALVQDTFGDFFELSGYVQEELLRIIDAFLTTGGSIVEIANLTFRHRNTVRNRLAQIEELSGLQLSSAKGAALLALSYPTLRRGLRGKS